MASNSLTLNASGSVAAPGAGAPIATLAAPPLGTYRVQVQVTLGGTGTIGAGDLNNVQLKLGSTVIGVVPSGAGAGPWSDWDVSLDGATAVTLNAVGAGTAAVSYAGIIQADAVTGAMNPVLPM